MARTIEMFEKPRQTPRTLAWPIDHGEGAGKGYTAHFECRKCGWSQWLSECTKTQARKGVPCPNCNEGVSYG